MKGLTLSCPNEECKEILLRYANFTGNGKFETLCPHCKKLVSVSFEQKCFAAACKIAVLFLILFASLIFIHSHHEYLANIYPVSVE